jgi:asparagine synthase (glutamine-hydrolysing)
MCRIAGIITSRPPEAAKELLASMLGSMVYERFDSYGSYCIPELGCYLGWVADGSENAGLNPAVNRGGDLIVVFAGEDFAGSSQKTSPAKSLLAAWETEGERSLRDLNGWFAGVVVDIRKREVILFNDRFGLHRIHYTQTDDALTFASEAKALLTVQPRTRNLNPKALGEFVVFGSVQNDRTLFQDVNVVPGGSVWTISAPAEIRKARYFTPAEWESQSVLSDEEFYESLKATMSTAVRRHFGDGSDIAVSLTGGVDTRVIMAFAEHAAEKRASYTFGGMYRDCYDVQIAGQVARACGYEHQVLRLGPEFLRNFSDYAEKTVWLTDGTLDLGATHEVYLNGLARKIARVRITGNYGSEVLRGASTFKLSGLSTNLFNPDFLPYIQDATRSFEQLKYGNQVSVAAFRQIPWHLYGRLNAAQSQLTVRSPYTDNDLVALAYRARPSARQSASLWNRLILEQHRSLASIPTDRGYVGTRSSLSTLPYRFYNYLLFKAEWYHEAGMPHRLARMERHLPAALRPLPFVGTHKIEQYRMWFREGLFEPLRSILGSKSTETPYVNVRRLQDMLTAHREGRANFVTDIQRLASIALIQKLFVAEFRNARPAQSVRLEQPLPRPARVAGAGR